MLVDPVVHHFHQPLRVGQFDAGVFVTQFEVAAQYGDVLGLFVVVDDTLLDVVVAQRVFGFGQHFARAFQLLLEIFDDVVRLAETQVLVLFDELFVEQDERIVGDARVVRFVGYLDHVAVAQSLDHDLAQRLVAVMAVRVMEQPVDVIVGAGLFIIFEVGEGVFFRVLVYQRDHLFGHMPHQGAVVGRRNVIGVFIRAAVHHGLCEQAQRDVAERTLRHDDVDQVVHRIVGRGPVLFAAVVRVDAVTGDRARVNGRAGLVRMRHFLRLVDDEQCSQRRTDQQPPADAVDEPEQVDQRVHGLVLFSDDFGVGHNLEPQQGVVQRCAGLFVLPDGGRLDVFLAAQRDGVDFSVHKIGFGDFILCDG